MRTEESSFRYLEGRNQYSSQALPADVIISLLTAVFIFFYYYYSASTLRSVQTHRDELTKYHSWSHSSSLNRLSALARLCFQCSLLSTRPELIMPSRARSSMTGRPDERCPERSSPNWRCPRLRGLPAVMSSISRGGSRGSMSRLSLRFDICCSAHVTWNTNMM